MPAQVWNLANVTRHPYLCSWCEGDPYLCRVLVQMDNGFTLKLNAQNATSEIAGDVTDFSGVTLVQQACIGQAGRSTTGDRSQADAMPRVTRHGTSRERIRTHQATGGKVSGANP
jgi:hypothetical protein